MRYIQGSLSDVTPDPVLTILIETWTPITFSGLDITGTNGTVSANPLLGGFRSVTGPFTSGARTPGDPAALDNFILGAIVRNNAVSTKMVGGNLAEVAVWSSTDLDIWERELLAKGIRPNAIRPEALFCYSSFQSNYVDTIISNMWSEGDLGDTPTSISTDHPAMINPIEVKYPIEQSDFDENALDTSIENYRATRLVNNFVIAARATQVQWEITPSGGKRFIYTTTASSESTGDPSVLTASLTTLDLWLPPSSKYTVRTRQHIDGAWTYWSPSFAFTSLGYINSFEKYAILNRGTISIP